jgi:molybdate transport system permease protein
MNADATRRARRRQPWPVIMLSVVAVSFFALPLVGLLSRMPWREAGPIVRSKAVLDALRLSVLFSLGATALSVSFGLPLAWTLAHRPFRGRSIVRGLCTLSMVLPPVAGGIALTYALGRRGLLGGAFDRWFGTQLFGTPWAVVIAQTFVAMPFFVVTVEAGLRQADTGLDDAARTLGGSSWYSFRRVTLPAIRSSLVAGAVLSWARAFGEFGATITFAGATPGRTRTLPTAMYLALEGSDRRPALVIALLMVGVSLAVLVGLRDRWLGGGARAA